MKIIGVVAAVVILCVVALFVAAGSGMLTGDERPRTFSSRAEQVEWTVDHMREDECEANARAVERPFHTITPEEDAVRHFCLMKALKARDPFVWKTALEPLRHQPPEGSR
jgi:hypothetical protein